MLKSSFVIVLWGLLLLSIGFVSAHEEMKNFTEVKELVDSKAACNSLTEVQMEKIGEYLMEQMHPGEAHEQMHDMMGLQEGSALEEQFHINMTQNMYCNNSSFDISMMSRMMANDSRQKGSFISSALFNILIIALIALVAVSTVKLSRGAIKK